MGLVEGGSFFLNKRGEDKVLGVERGGGGREPGGKKLRKGEWNTTPPRHQTKRRLVSEESIELSYFNYSFFESAKGTPESALTRFCQTKRKVKEERIEKVERVIEWDGKFSKKMYS